MNKEQTLTLDNGLKVALQIWGEQHKPPLLALHGWLDNSNSFAKLAPLLCEKFQIVAIDFIGHGYSDHLPKCCNYHYIDAIDHIAAIANKLDLQTFSLLGHSMGATLASIFAATFPERVESLYLIEGLGPLVDKPEHANERLRKHVLEVERGRKIKSYSDINDAIAVRAKNTPMDFDSAALIIKRGMIETNKLFYWRHDLRLLYTSAIVYTEDHVKNFLRAIQCPTVLVWANNGIKQFYPNLSLRENYVKSLITHEISGAHHVHLDAAENTFHSLLI